MKMTMGELREIIDEELKWDHRPRPMHGTALGRYLLKRWVTLLEADGYQYSPAFYDSRDGIIWPVVRSGSEKVLFEFEDTMALRDDHAGWLLLQHCDLENALRFFTEDTQSGVPYTKAKERLIEELRLAALLL